MKYEIRKIEIKFEKTNETINNSMLLKNCK